MIGAAPLLLALAAAAAPAAAGAPRLALPPWPLSPDGELVAAPPGVPLAAEGASVAPVAPGLWRVTPAPGAGEVVLRAGEARAVAAVEPAPGPLTIAWAGDGPVKGRDAGLAITFTLPPGLPTGDAPPAWLAASAGEVAPTGPGAATLRLPASRHPEVVALFALAPRRAGDRTPAALGAALLPLPAAIELPGTTDPGVTTYVELGGQVFGPVTADRSGRFKVPVVVPPGVARGEARSINAIGNERRKPIDLGLPPAPRLGCVASPRVLPADGRSRALLHCLAWSPTGEPVAGARLDFGAPRGQVRELPAVARTGAVVTAEYLAPQGGPGPVEVAVTWPEAGQAGRVAVALTLTPGGPAEIDWWLAREPLRPGESVAARAVARDAAGAPLGPAVAEGPHAGELAAGRFTARAELGDGLDGAVLAFALPPAPPAEASALTLRRDGSAWVAELRAAGGRPVPGVELAFGGGARATTDGAGEARVTASGAEETVRGPLGLRAAAWAWAPPPPAPAALARPVTVALVPPGAVDVEVDLEGGFVTWEVRGPGGEAEPERPVTLRAGGVALGPPERRGAGWRAAVQGGRGWVAVVDEATGAAGAVEVP